MPKPEKKEWKELVLSLDNSEEKKLEPPSLYFFNQLISVLPEVDKFSDACDQFFTLLENLLKAYKALLKKFKIICTPCFGEQRKW